MLFGPCCLYHAAQCPCHLVRSEGIESKYRAIVGGALRKDKAQEALIATASGVDVVATLTPVIRMYHTWQCAKGEG